MSADTEKLAEKRGWMRACRNGKEVWYDPTGGHVMPTELPAALKFAEQSECDHTWEFRDESFDHEFGCERVHFWECSKCGATKPTCDADYGQPEPDDECEMP